MQSFPGKIKNYSLRTCSLRAYSLRTYSLRAYSLRALGLFALAAMQVLTPEQAWAYRPFDSTDAAVIDDGEFEIELGVFSWERSNDDNTSITPQLVVNYGLSDTLELIGEFEVEHSPDGKSQLVDPGLFVKSVFKQGILQNQQGLSIAAETGLLLPSSAEGEDELGVEAIGIISGMISNYSWHLNFGAGIEREDHKAFALWGIIVELPTLNFASGDLRFVGELNSESIRGESAETSALVGMLWEPASLQNMTLDIGIRRGISDTAADWGATLGLSFSF